MVAGIWMLIEDIQNRNYLHGYDIYMHLAVGTSFHSKPTTLPLTKCVVADNGFSYRSRKQHQLRICFAI